MIHLQRVSLERGGRRILHDLSLDFTPGTITAVVGRSGVGKSSLLALLNGLLSPLEGDIWSDEVGLLNSAAAWQHQRQRTATVFQQPALIERLSALENVLLGLAEQRHPLALLPWPKALWLKAAEALERVDLLPLASMRVERMSGGERQRVGLARALVREPGLLLGDEPLSAVDPALVSQMSGLLRQMATTGCTLVLVMHQIETALALADRIVGLAEGRVVFDGAAREFSEITHRRIFYPHQRHVA